MSKCKVCKLEDSYKPMCFRGTEWCCENHHKVIIGDKQTQPAIKIEKENV